MGFFSFLNLGGRGHKATCASSNSATSHHKLVRDSISLFLCELYVTVCLSVELMAAASLRKKECNPPGIQWKELLCIPGTSRGCSHLVGSEGVC